MKRTIQVSNFQNTPNQKSFWSAIRKKVDKLQIETLITFHKRQFVTEMKIAWNFFFIHLWSTRELFLTSMALKEEKIEGIH